MKVGDGHKVVCEIRRRGDGFTTAFLRSMNQGRDGNSYRTELFASSFPKGYSEFLAFGGWNFVY